MVSIDKTKKMGRPSLGVTRKVSLTLTEDIWGQIYKLVDDSQQSQSKVLRGIIEEFFKKKALEE